MAADPPPITQPRFAGFPDVRAAHGLAFTAGIDGIQECGEQPVAISDQCDRVYARLTALLRGGGAGKIARIDHFTESQDWLAERQIVRARHFGSPAPLASTGVATSHTSGNRLTAAAIAPLGTCDPEVLIDGASHGMPAIATAVGCGPYVFISGILPRGGDWVAQARAATNEISGILRKLGLAPSQVLRVDTYHAPKIDRVALLGHCRQMFGAAPAMRAVACTFSGASLLEITTLAVRGEVTRGVHGPDGTLLGCSVTRGLSCLDEIAVGDVADIVPTLAQCTARFERGLEDIVRLDLCLPSERAIDPAIARLKASWAAGATPTIVAINARDARLIRALAMLR
jgi:enamine deaminase RidA (YjgF/YER057c/UK114 family)